MVINDKHNPLSRAQSTKNGQLQGRVINSFFDVLTVNFLLNSLLVKKEAYSNGEPKDDIAWQQFKP